MSRSGVASRLRELAVACIAVLLLIAPAWAHVGNPDVYFQGAAGPYHLVITIRTPQMIPGTADVEILSATPGISKITVVPLYIVGPGAKYPPVGDLLALRAQVMLGLLAVVKTNARQLATFGLARAIAQRHPRIDLKSAPGVMQINENAAPGFGNRGERAVNGGGAVTRGGTEDVAGKAVGVDTNQRSDIFASARGRSGLSNISG